MNSHPAESLELGSANTLGSSEYRDATERTRSNAAPKYSSRRCNPLATSFVNVGRCRTGKIGWIASKYMAMRLVIRSLSGKT